MAVFIKVKDPKGLLDDIKSAVENGEIQTWVCDSDGDFTLSDEDLKNEAWFHPYQVVGDTLVFGIVGRKNVKMPMSLFSTYHGELTKTLLMNYGGQLGDFMIVPPFANDFDTKSIENR